VRRLAELAATGGCSDNTRPDAARKASRNRGAAVIAFISDLHSNREALDAAFQDLDGQGVDSVVCLGDIIGYGADPKHVVRLTMERCAVALQGNHDAALLDDRDALGFNERALRAIDWTRKALDPEKEEHWPLWDWLGSLVPAMELDPGNGTEAVQIVHASPREPLSEYLMPGTSASDDRLRANFKAVEHRLAFYGHTHHPGWFAEGDGFARAEGDEPVLKLEPERRYLINVGSVGQPRDGDPRLCYALFDGETVRWRRVAYDHETASRRIRESGLPESLAARLLVGR
jgi:diadenosine tetraphosphatase ApaH/serine/threonine PP2A family protein phosphatase